MQYDFHNIHRFQMDEDRILLDVNSGSVHVIDEGIDRFLDFLADGQDMQKAQEKTAQIYGQAEAAEIAADVQSLIAEDMLFSEDGYAGGYQPPKAQLKSLCLNIAHDCDLRCKYCFASTGHFGGKRELMPARIACDALDYLARESGARKFCEVDFFGGEPLLNLDAVKTAVAHAQKLEKEYGKSIKLTMTTNAHSITDETIDWLEETGISIVLSHDGRPEIHNKMRGNSYDKVTANIKKIIARRGQNNYYVRGTYSANNLDFTNDIKHWLSQDMRLLSMEPVVTTDDVDWALHEKDLPRIKEEYHTLAHFYLEEMQKGKPFEFFHFNLDLTGGPCLPKRLCGCGAGFEYMAVAPNGDLYPCHQFVGREEYLLGNIYDGVKRTDIVEKFRQNHIYHKPECASCWARFYCSGGCAANAQSFHQDITKPYDLGCAISKLRLEAAIWLAVKKIMLEAEKAGTEA